MGLRPCVRWLCPIGAVLGTMWAFSPMEVGKPIPPLALGIGKKTIQSERLAQDGPVAVLWRGAALAPEDCAALATADQRVSGDRVRFLVLTAESQPCEATAKYLMQVEHGQLEKLGISGRADTEWRLVVVDPYGVVRILETLPAGRAGVERAAIVATDWEAGRQSFITNCGHCHGNDGADLSYTGIKTLAGISRRMTAQQILEGGQQSGAVDMTAWSQSAKDALLLYIASL
jgi:cytochrome c553